MSARTIGVRVAFVALLASLAPHAARAAGYAIIEQGAAASGMAGAATASVNDASAVFYNPAMLARLQGKNTLLVGGAALTPVTSFAGVNPFPGYGVTERSKTRTLGIPGVYYTRRSAERWSMGAGLNTPFGIDESWRDEETFTGRFIGTHARLFTLNAQLVAAYEIDPHWSVAAGGNALFAGLDLRRFILAPAPGGGGGTVNIARLDLTQDLTPGYGWTAAVAWVPSVFWKLGATYRGKVIVHSEGDADFTQIPTSDPAYDAMVASQLPPDQTARAVLTFPAVWSAAAAWLPNAAWTLEAGGSVTQWSAFHDLPIRFEQSPAADLLVPENYDDSFELRFGAEHRVTDYFTYRFGYAFQGSAAPDASVNPLLPEADRHGLSFGVGWMFGSQRAWQIDAYELATFQPNRSTNSQSADGYDGTYKCYINGAGLSLARRW